MANAEAVSGSLKKYGKKYRSAFQNVEVGKKYSLEDAVALVGFVGYSDGTCGRGVGV